MEQTLTLDQACLRVGTKTILQPTHLDITPGKITAILGPNGSGKSTLLKLLSGLIEPSEGQVLLGGQLLKSLHRKELAKSLALLPQHSPVPLGMSAKDLVACGRYPHAGPFGRLKKEDHRAVSSALSRVGMDHYASELVDHLSGGEMQRVWLAMVLAQETGILLLDEPTSWLDIAHQLRLLNIVRQLNDEKQTTIIWVLHDLNQALQYSDEIVLMNQGQVIRTGAATKVLDKRIISDVFGVETREVQLEGKKESLFLPLGERKAKPVIHGVSSREVA
ncbi:ABC transporter ATP-binding protein [Endozoicomonas sp. 8E]|uniref:ABC transporter ATP-binding protein n=1 Tax=Endozoicomonas sp. 8E TaxID=3035692 RepID=UPI0029393FCB|nr:ABC transporter ATP-binding protein [Endozoicomonas sp. 8E]WOG27636.1 ABC transporter ATP-binding protein [Endozoicomonas sp. 8E]